MRNDWYRGFWFGGPLDRPKRPQIWVQVHPLCDGRWCASGFSHRGSILQWHLDARAACHICERKWPISWRRAAKDYYSSSGADLHLDCGVAGEALGPAIIQPTGRATRKDPGESVEKKAVEDGFVPKKCNRIAIPLTLPSKYRPSKGWYTGSSPVRATMAK